MSDLDTRLAEYRSQKDQFFRSEQSPLDAKKRQAFTGLSYFPTNPELVFNLPVESVPDQAFPEFELQTSQNTSRFMAVLGQVTLPFDSVLPQADQQSLFIFAPLGEEPPSYAFIPFKDQTSGQETYGAGRYLDIAWTAETQSTKEILLDFNMAYHPLCLFAEHYTCPLPPTENHLNIAIRAGECLSQLD